MDQKGGCCIARYSASTGIYDMSNKVDRIMLKFRPIAPKPAVSATASLSGGGSNSTTPENSTDQPSLKTTTAGRGRKRTRVTNKETASVNKRCRKRKSSSSSDDGDTRNVVKTLLLLPEVPVKNNNYPKWLSFADPSVEVERKVVVRSWVKVECLMGDIGLYGGLGGTDQERVLALDRDTCPGFVSDGVNGVRWMNEAYKRMVGGEGGQGQVDVVAEVLMGEGVVVPGGCRAFTCRVRVVTCGKGKGGCQTVPCDVWRMDCGGFAWRLDTKAALSLGCF